MTRRNCFAAAEALRLRNGLPPIKSLQNQLYISRDLTLLAASPVLIPQQPDWGDHIQVCGFLNSQVVHKWRMPDDLRSFLDRGEPPVYFTFGSFSQTSSEETTQIFVEAVRRSGRRGIIQSDWKNFQLTPDDPTIYKVTRIPHDQVFPHCSLIVHHGGAGTTQSALRSGNPSLVVEHAFDQTYWGEKLRRAGVGGKVLHRRSLTSTMLADSISYLLDRKELKEKAELLGSAMRQEDGVANAVRIIEERFVV